MGGKNACPCRWTLCERLFYNKKDSDTCAESSKEIEVVSNGAIYKATWRYEARTEDELSFQEGDYFHIVDRPGHWWTVRKVDRNGRILDTGIVPSTHLARGSSVEVQQWFFGSMNRLEASHCLLAPENGEGAFLVRLTETDNPYYVLSVKSDNKVNHFKIRRNKEQFFLDKTDKSESFTSLMDLVEHFKSHPIPSSSVRRLGNSCVRREPKPQDLSHTTVDEWELPKEEFTLGEQLGSGFFADVYRGRWKNKINVAIKVLKKNDFLDHKAFQNEIQVLKKLRHKHLISLFAICSSSPPFYIITELMEKGDLLNFLRGPEGGALDLVSLIDMAAQVADGMAYLESQNSIHRDLAARNVLVGHSNICKVADFGLARIIKEPIYTTEDKKIPYKWSAPEALSRGEFSSQSDVWSFGVLLYEVITYGGKPYPGYSNAEMPELISSGYRMPAPPQCPEYIYEIMLSCWRDAPEDRASFRLLKLKLESCCKELEE